MAQNNIIDVKRTEITPVTEPVTLAEAKAQLIVTYSDDDTFIAALITQARKAIENFCNISIVNKTIILIADLFNEWELPYGPVTAIQGVQTRNGYEGSGPASYSTQTSGWQTDGSEFLVFMPSTLGGFDINVPYTGNDRAPLVRRYKIQYAAGYGTLPDDLKQAILQEIAYRYENRGDAENIRASEFTQQGACEPARLLATPYIRNLWL